MSISCSIDKNKLEYQTLKKMSGLSDFDLDTFVGNYYEENGRFPELDEIPYANSINYFKDALSIKDNKNFSYTDINTILEYTSSETTEEAIKKLNNEFKDLELDIIPLDNKCIVKINKRPSKYNIIQASDYEVETDFNTEKSNAVMSKLISKLNRLYGTKFIFGTTQELGTIVPNAAISKAFVHNNEVYINTDLATIDSPIHELLHLFFGSMRYTDPDFYFNMVTQIKNISSFDKLASVYKNRTNLDLCEEVFVEELAKLLTGQDSSLSKLSDSEITKIIYNINRTLDSMLMGEYSVQSCSTGNTLLQLAKLTKSKVMNGFTIGEVSRKTSNLKSKLLQEGSLIEQC